MTSARSIPHRASSLPRLGALRALVGACASSFVVGASGQPRLTSHEPGLKNEIPAPIKGMDLAPRLGERIPLDLPFTDAGGKAVRLGDYFNRPARDQSGNPIGTNKPVVLVMVYFRCTLQCPMVLERFTNALKGVDFTAGREYDAVVVSFDHRDTSTDAALYRNAQVSSYARATADEAREGWNFLVGNPESSRALGDALGFPYRYLPESGEFSHPNSVFILTPEGRISRQFTGLDYPAADVRRGLVEASEGRIGTLLDKFTFWCFHFDPLAGSYSLRWMRVMQIGAGVAALALAGLVGTMLLRDRSRRAVLSPSTPAGAPAAPRSIARGA